MIGSRTRFAVLALPLVGLLLLGGRAAPAAGVEQTKAGTIDLRGFLDGFWPEAERAGVSRGTFDAAFAGLTPDPSLAALTRRQPEFAKPIGAYLAAQVTAGRVAQGRTMLERWRSALDAIERRFGVPPAIVVAIWGLETNYGAVAGSKDVLRSVATLAAMNYRPTLYRAELIAALTMLQSGDVSPQNLRGSWAGAMGQPQFMPSSFLNYAVDWDGDGRRNIWTSVPDTLASIAQFIRMQGWQTGRPWGFEVRVPAGFDLSISRGSYADFVAKGVARADGTPLPAGGTGILFYPAGAAGPAFLVTENFEVLKTYNFSDAYVLSIGQLADRMAGGAVVQAPWPNDAPMSRDSRIALQARLVGLSYPVDNREGRISLALRDTIRRAQIHVGMVPDGNPTDALLQALDR